MRPLACAHLDDILKAIVTLVLLVQQLVVRLETLYKEAPRARVVSHSRNHVTQVRHPDILHHVPPGVLQDLRVPCMGEPSERRGTLRRVLRCRGNLLHRSPLCATAFSDHL